MSWPPKLVGIAINLFTLLSFGKKQMGIQGFKIMARQRARLVGKMDSIERAIQAAQAELLELKTKVDAYDLVLHAQGIDVDADTYAPPICPTPRKNYFEHGELTGACLSLFRTERRPLTTVQIFDAVLFVKKRVWRNLEDPVQLRQNIRDLLKRCQRRGLVVRIGKVGPGQNDPAIWALPEHASIPWSDVAVSIHQVGG